MLFPENDTIHTYRNVFYTKGTKKVLRFPRIYKLSTQYEYKYSNTIVKFPLSFEARQRVNKKMLEKL